MVSFSTIHTGVKKLVAGLIVGSVLCGFVSGTALAQSSASEAEYEALLTEIQNVKTLIEFRGVNINEQKKQIESLKAQMEQVSGLTASVEPMLNKMVESISNEIERDLPFNISTRYEQLDKFREVVGDKNARPGEKIRLALRTYEEEVNYGQTVEAYGGEHPVTDKRGSRFAACEADYTSGKCALSNELKKQVEAGASVAAFEPLIKDGYYLRYGRLALAFVTADESEVYFYNPNEKVWEIVSGGRALDVARGVRSARGEAAPDVLEVPIYIADSAGG